MKAYVKPELFYERYELSKHIADCYWNMNYGTDGGCTGDASDQGTPEILFAEGSSCTITTDVVENWCNQNSMGIKVVFIS